MSLRSHPAVLRTIERTRGIAERLIAVRIVEMSIVLAAQAFLALFPLILVVAAVVPRDVSTGLVNELRSRYGVSGSSAGALQTVLVDRGALQQSLSVFSFLLVIASASAFTRALQRMYQNAWGLPKLGLRGVWRSFAWLIGLVVYLGILGTIAHFIHHGGVLAPVSTILGFGMWWWTPFLLLGGRVRARALIPAAVIITGAQLAAGLVSSAIVPRTIRNNESSYGPIGAVFAFQSWLVIVMGLLVVGTTLGAIIGSSDSRIGQWIRGTSDPDGWRREPKQVRVARLKRPTPADGAGDDTWALTVRPTAAPRSAGRRSARSARRSRPIMPPACPYRSIPARRMRTGLRTTTGRRPTSRRWTSPQWMAGGRR